MSTNASSLHAASPGLLLRAATDAELDRWNALVEAAPLGTPFHRLEWLRAIEATSGYRLHSLVAERDGTLVGTFPLFERRRMGLRLLASPPPRSLVHALGPLLCGNGGSPSERERTALAFFGAAFAAVAGHGTRTLVSVKADLPFGAARAATWQDLRVTPRYTYVVPLDRPVEAILGSLSRYSRSSVRKTATLRVDLRCSHDVEDALRVYRLSSGRYGEQGMGAPCSQRYLEAVWSAVGADHLAAFCLERDGEFLTGMIAALDGRTLYCICGAPRMEVDRVSVNEFLHLRVMEWARARGIEGYDLLGANTPRLLDFKRKLRPSLREMFTVESDTILATLARRLYARAIR